MLKVVKCEDCCGRVLYSVKMDLLRFTVVWLSVGIISAMDIPEGYVFAVQPSCSKTIDGISSIHVLTDLDVHVEAECKDGFLAQFSTVNYVDWYLNSTYQGDTHLKCIFTKKNVSNAYLIFLSVSWAEPGEIMLNHDIYMITCVMDDHGKTQSGVKTIRQGLLGPREIQSHMGGDASSEFTLQLTDVRGDSLGDVVPLGRRVRLTAKMLASSDPNAADENGLRAISCDAVGGDSSYKILRGGCGDGMVIPKDIGFTTSGLVSESPVFTTFRLAKSKTLSFQCNFTTCVTSCDGDSCVVEADSRRRRSNTEPLVLIPMRLDLEVRSADDDTEDQNADRVDKSIDTEVVNPCSIPGMSLEGCPEEHLSRKFPVGMTALMVVVMVAFPMLLVIGLAAFFCCWKSESYGLDQTEKYPS